MEKNIDRILWTILILSISVGLGLIYLNHSPHIMNDTKNTIGSIVDNLDSNSDNSLVDKDDNSPFTYQYDTNTKTATITGYKLTSGNDLPANLKIPAYKEHDGVKYTVTSIGNNAFYQASAPAQGFRVTLPNTIKTIGTSAFYGEPLIGINLPEGLVSIGDQAFYDTKLIDIMIPSTLETIGVYAFSDNSELTSVGMSNATSLTSISDYAFINDPNLVSVDMSNATILTSISSNAFMYDQKLASLKLPLNGKLSSIGDYSFYGTALTKIEIPASVTKIGRRAFQYVANGASVVIHSSKGSITYVVDNKGTTSTTPATSTFNDKSYKSLIPTYVTN